MIRVFFTVLESFVLPTCNEQHSVQRSWRVPFFSFFLFFYFYVMSNTLYKNHGQFLFFFLFYLVSSQPATRVRANDALRTVLVITTTFTLPAYHMHKRTATQRMVRFSVIRVLFTVLDSFVFRHLLKSYSNLEGEQNSLKHQKYIIFALQASASPLP